MTSKARSNLRRVALAAALVALAGPALAQMGQPPGQGGGPPPPHRHRGHGDIGAGIAAGVLGGLAGAALANGQGEPPPPDYGYPPPPPPGPRYGAYDADDEVECRIVRKPVYDEDGEVVSYRTRRICQ